MSIKGVDPTCYILALFVRDDGERFLLGSGSYVFKGKQMHFQANTIQNDAVEVQGADGYLLAGQVRRPGSQDFDGYVGSGTASKTEVEANRRAFFSFFRKNYFYKVVYVFPNGTAIQRKRGFLVDDPTVKELYQVNPEYHVALNFEDVNYYSYSENDEGEEIYAKDAIIHLSAGASSGGLVWDAVGVEWEAIVWSNVLNASGSEFVILNNAGARAPLSDIELQGDTTQITYSGKNLFDKSTITPINTATTITQIDNGWHQVTNNGYGGKITITDLLPSTTYTLSWHTQVISGGPRVTVWKGTGQGSGSYAQQYSISTGDYSLTFTTDSDKTALNIWFYDAVPGNGETVWTYAQLEKSASATPYEPYVGGTPSPSPDYPQAINVVTGEQTVTVTGKNLFDVNTLAVGDITVTGGVAHATAGQYVAQFGPSTSGISFNATGQITISAMAKTGSEQASNGLGLTIRIVYADSTNTQVSWNNNDNTYVRRSVTSDSNKTISKVVISYIQSVNNIWDIKDFMIESGSTPTEYTPFVGFQTYTIDLGSTELCKIGDYQDYIYKSGDDWYVHKEIGKYTLTGNEEWTQGATTATRTNFRTEIPNINPYTDNSKKPDVFVNRFTPVSYNANWFVGGVSSRNTTSQMLYFIVDQSFTLNSWKTWLTTSDVTVYYQLATPTDTQITDATLIGELEAVLALKLLLGTNNVNISATSTNLPAILDVDYFTEWGGGGAVWEEGGPAGPTIVEVDSIDTVYPIWQVTGPATNPQLTVLTTNTTIQYNGNITSSQILEIDMFNKTATLNGASVIGNVSGDWIQFAPDNNRVTYTADNADAPESKTMWQEIVG